MYVERESLAITRQFANFGDRQLHYRIAGQGPALLLLHQSPTSSAEMASQLESLAAEFTVIAPDLPGYGLSDPLPVTEPDMAPFADAICELLDVLGIEQVCAYGFHTGAMLAAELAYRHPERLTAAIIDGLVLLTSAERQELMANYFQEAQPQPDGGHLPFSWARIRDQLLFFPWYRKDHAVRMNLDLPPASALQPFVVDLLRTRSKLGYRAAFAYPTAERVAQWQIPVYLLNFEKDPIGHHPQRLDSLPDCVHHEVVADPDAVTARATELARQYAPASVEIPRHSTGDCSLTLAHQITATAAGPAHQLHREGDPNAPRWLILHEPGSAARRWEDLISGWPAGHSVTALDLPGHGETGNIHLDNFTAGSQAEWVASTLGDGASPTHVIGVGLSANIALELARQQPDRIGKVALLEPWLLPPQQLQSLESRYAPPFTPADYGQHLLEAWYWVRDGQLFWPWYDTRDDCRLGDFTQLAPPWLHDRTVELLQGANHLRAAVWALMDYDLEVALQSHMEPLLLLGRSAQGPRAEAAQNAAAVAANGRFEALPAGEQQWGNHLSQWIAP